MYSLPKIVVGGWSELNQVSRVPHSSDLCEDSAWKQTKCNLHDSKEKEHSACTFDRSLAIYAVCAEPLFISLEQTAAMAATIGEKIPKIAVQAAVASTCIDACNSTGSSPIREIFRTGTLIVPRISTAQILWRGRPTKQSTPSIPRFLGL